MTDDDRVLRLLGDVLDRQPTSAPDRLLTTVLDKLQTAPQRGRWFLPNWRDLLTADDCEAYDARARAELGLDCAAWLKGGPAHR